MWVERCSVRCLFGLGLLTGITSHGIVLDVLAHPGPEVVSGDELQGLVVSWVPGSGVVVVCVDDLPS